MVVKRRNWITHIILIILVIVILFPIVWVVSTSLRRDDAAFSTKLFSSRLSLQNYKDLIFPEKNVLRRLKDIESITTNSIPYTNEPYDYLLSKFNEDIEALKNYSYETKELIKITDNEYENVKNFITNNSNKLIEGLVENANLIKGKLNENKPEDEKLYVALNILLKEGSLKERDIDDYFDLNKVKEYEKIWEDKFLNLSEEINKKENEIKTLENQINLLKKDLDYYQKEYTRISNVISESIYPQFLNFEETLDVALNILKSSDNSINVFVYETNELEEFEKVKYYLEKISDAKFPEEFSNFAEVIHRLNNLASEILSTWKGFQNKSSSKYADFLSAIRLFNLSASKELKESVDLVVKFSEIVENYIEKTNLLNALSKELENDKLELEKLKAEYEKKKLEINEAVRFVYSVILNNNIESFNSKIEKYNLPKDIRKAYFAIKSLRNDLNSYLYYVDDTEKRKELRAYIRNMSWVETYMNFEKRFEDFLENMEAFLDEFDTYVKNIEEIGPGAIRSAKNGIKIRISALSQLFPKIQSNYPAKISSNLSLASKLAIDLVDSLPLDGANSSLKVIDKKLFRIDQIWQEKTEHHLLRWIMNSIIVAGLVAIITTLVNALAAYPFSRMRFRGRKYGIMSLLLIQMFPAIMYMIALYGFLSFLGRYIPFLGLNTLGGLIFVYLGGIAFNMYLIKGFYDTIPSSLEEAAMIDGATRWQTFWRIVFPLASPILAVVVILTFMGTFNEFVLAKIILQDVQKYTYAVGLWVFSTGPFETEWGLFSAAALIGMTPMVILFLSLQKYLVGGLTKGSVKG